MNPARVIQLPTRPAADAEIVLPDGEPRPDLAWEQARINEAVEGWSEWLRRDPTRMELRMRLAEAAILQHRWDDAARELSLRLTVSPQDAKLLSTIALCYRHAGDEEASQLCLEQALRLDPKNRLGAAAQRSNVEQAARPAQGLLVWECEAREIDSAVDRLFADAVVALEMGFLEEAERRLEELLLLDPAHWEALFELGHLHDVGGRTPWARFFYEQAIRCCPQAWEPHFNLARLLYQAGDAAAARPLLERAFLMEPTSAETAWLLASACLALGDSDEGSVWLGKASRLAPDNAAIYAQLGSRALEQGQIDEAALWYRRAVKADGKSAAAAYNLGLCEWKLGRVDKSRAAWNAHTESPEVAHALTALALEAHDWPQAEQLLSKHDHAGLRFAIAGEFASLGKTKHAIRHYEAGLRLAPDHGEAWLNLGLLLREYGDAAASLRALQSALEAAPELAAEYFG